MKHTYHQGWSNGCRCTQSGCWPGWGYVQLEFECSGGPHTRRGPSCKCVLLTEGSIEELKLECEGKGVELGKRRNAKHALGWLACSAGGANNGESGTSQRWVGRERKRKERKVFSGREDRRTSTAQFNSSLQEALRFKWREYGRLLSNWADRASIDGEEFLIYLMKVNKKKGNYLVESCGRKELFHLLLHNLTTSKAPTEVPMNFQMKEEFDVILFICQIERTVLPSTAVHYNLNQGIVYASCSPRRISLRRPVLLPTTTTNITISRSSTASPWRLLHCASSSSTWTACPLAARQPLDTDRQQCRGQQPLDDCNCGATKATSAEVSNSSSYYPPPPPPQPPSVFMRVSKVFVTTGSSWSTTTTTTTAKRRCWPNTDVIFDHSGCSLLKSHHLTQNIPQRLSANSSDTFLVIFFKFCMLQSTTTSDHCQSFTEWLHYFSIAHSRVSNPK